MDREITVVVSQHCAQRDPAGFALTLKGIRLPAIREVGVFGRRVAGPPTGVLGKENGRSGVCVRRIAQVFELYHSPGGPNPPAPFPIRSSLAREGGEPRSRVPLSRSVEEGDRG